jgi:hypothetical protein
MTDFPDFDPKTIPQHGDQHKAAVRSNRALQPGRVSNGVR